MKPLYLDQPAVTSCTARVTHVGTFENYNYIQLDQTIFHPKGGGQPSDAGTIQGISVTHVHKLTPDKSRLDLFEVWHCFSQEIPFKEGDLVELKIDPVKRKLYSRMHTAGHVLATVTQKHDPNLEGFHGNHDPQNGFVKFKILQERNYDKNLLQVLQPKINQYLSENLPITSEIQPSGLRVMLMGDTTMACGGTHVDELREIGTLEIYDLSHNKKESTLTIKYRLKD